VALAAVGKADEALIQYQEAIRIDPKASQLDLHSAKALNTLGRLDEAIEQCRLAIGIDPKSTQAHSTLGALLDSKGRVNESIEEYQRTIALDPKLNSSHRDLRIILRLQGRDEEARAVWERATAAISLEHDVFYGYAEFCLFLGREDEYRRARRALLDAFGASTSPFIAERTARACLLLPTSDDELARIVALGERAWSFDPSKYPTSFLHFVFVRGLAEYRQGRLDSAIATMQGQASRVLGPAPRLVLAMALHRSGREVEARKALAQAVLAHDWRPSKVADQDDWIYHSLRREAEAMILPKLSAYLDGSCQPRDNDERLASLGACQFLNRHVASARLDSDAFTADPSLADDLRSGHRLKAACAATLAGSGQGAEAIGPGGESERRRWRLQARQ
jgi:tetratricopeptide (TPR) repeat protein